MGDTAYGSSAEGPPEINVKACVQARFHTVCLKMVYAGYK